MKQTGIMIVLGMLLAAACFGVWHFWSESVDFKKLYEGSSVLVEKYNTEKVQYVKDLDELREKLKPLDGGLEQPKKGLKGVTVGKTGKQSSGGGKAESHGELIPASVTESVMGEYTFEDYHLSITFYTLPGEFKYMLDQKFEIRHFDYGEKVQIEMAEIDKEGKVRQVYEFSIDSYKEKPKGKFFTGFNLEIGGAGLITQTFKGNYSVHALGNFMSYGVSHLDSDWRFLSLGAGYPGFVVSPVQYRISNHIPLFSDIFIDPIVLMDYKGKLSFGLGLSSTL